MRMTQVNLIAATLVVTWFSAAASGAFASEIVLVCRVIDTSGQPIPGVQAVVRMIANADPKSGETVVEDTLQKLMSSDSEGIVTAGSLTAGSAHVVELSLDGYVPACSRRSHIDDTGAVRLPDVTLRRLRTVEGRVVDSSGHPLPDVTIRHAGDGPAWTTSLNDVDGTFRLDGVPEGLALVFAERAGFWFTGKRVPAGDQPLEFILTPRSRPNPEQCDVNRTLSAAILESEIKTRPVDELIEDIRRASIDGDRPILYQLWPQLGTIDEARAMALLEELKIEKGERAGLIQRLIQRLVHTEMERDFENGRALLRECEDPNERVSTIVYDLLRLSSLDGDQKQALLTVAVTDLRSIQDPLIRVRFTSSLLKPLNDSGARSTVDQLVDEAVTLLDKAGDATTIQNNVGSLAEALAPIDPGRALTLLEKSAPMFSAWVATGIARHDPGKAAEMLRSYEYSGTSGSRLGRWHNLPRACYFMASADVDQAVSIAELINGIVYETTRFSVYVPSAFGGSGVNRSEIRNLVDQTTNILSQVLPRSSEPAADPVVILLKSRIHGFIAQAIAKSDPQRALALIEGSVNVIMPLREGVRNHGGGFVYTPSLFMASLIPAAAKVDPGVAAEVCWRTLALRLPATGTDDEERALLDIAELNSLIAIATLDHQLAVELSQAISQRGTNRSFDGNSTFVGTWPLYLWRTIDPVSGQQWINTLCDRGVAGATSPRSNISRRWASFASSGEPRHRKPWLHQAETWMNSIMWIDGFVNVED